MATRKRTHLHPTTRKSSAHPHPTTSKAGSRWGPRRRGPRRLIDVRDKLKNLRPGKHLVHRTKDGLKLFVEAKAGPVKSIRFLVLDAKGKTLAVSQSSSSAPGGAICRVCIEEGGQRICWRVPCRFLAAN